MADRREWKNSRKSGVEPKGSRLYTACKIYLLQVFFSAGKLEKKDLLKSSPCSMYPFLLCLCLLGWYFPLKGTVGLIKFLDYFLNLECEVMIPTGS